MSVPKIDLIAEDFARWKNDGYNDGIPAICASIMDAINAGLQFAFEAGWEACDQRHSALGKKKKTEQQKGRDGMGTKNERSNSAKQRQKMASKSGHKK